MKYNLVAENPESTVVIEFDPSAYKRATDYQSEAELEKEFIKILTEQGYTYLPITQEQDLLANLRVQLEKLNNYEFSDTEWEQICDKYLINSNEGIEEKTRKVQEDYIYNLTRDDDTTKNIKIIDKKNIHNNSVQVVNQYESKGARINRYDVTVLVNGLPLVHIELKRRGADLKEAFNQINRYQRESFWADSGLFEYAQIFVISNGTYTKYYSNTTRTSHIKEFNGARTGSSRRTSNSYEFTSWWADASNKAIYDIVGFARTFFAKHSLLSILTRYCVFTSDKLLLAMRPYQIVATERIINRIEIATNYNKLGTTEAGGYIWHTTGSGKTLTSFKTAQLASQLSYIDKVLFVVDRKDLDYQTMKEYDKFQKGAANSNTSTRILQKQLEDPNARIIITTIQKLAKFISLNSNHEIYNKHVVVIFDECHRSQFGDMHTSITRAFNNYHIFGFTGTPIFAVNAGSGGNPQFKTTEQAFGAKLHTYTIVDAINDKNVLPFRVDYHETMKQAENIDDAKVRAIDIEKALLSPQRVKLIVEYIRDRFNQYTYRNQNRSHFEHSIITNVSEMAGSRQNTVFEQKERRRVNGFNSILATASVDAAKKYYSEFRRQQAELPEAQRLKVGLIYSFGANEDLDDLGQSGIVDENNENVDGLDKSSRDFLDSAIADYNAYFNTNYDSSADKFQNYYKDISMRVKNRDLDLLIVVNMFLTGFDATTLNTLWVDKNLRQHGLIQAFSRTNRILNSVKVFGNIVCFRNLEKATNNALALFGNKEARGTVLVKTFSEYYYGYEENNKHVKGYEELILEITQKYPLGEPIIGEESQREFIRLYSAILRIKNILSSFDQFSGREILSERDFQDYQSTYINFYQEWRSRGNSEKENINEDIVFEIELVKQVEINIDYILMLAKKYRDSNMQDKEIKVSISKAIDSSIELRNKKDLIEQFIDSLTVSSEVDEDWRKFMDEKKKAELEQIIADEGLNSDETYRFIDRAFRDGAITQTGTAITKILPPVSRFSVDNLHAAKKRTVLNRLIAFFDRFSGI